MHKTTSQKNHHSELLKRQFDDYLIEYLVIENTAAQLTRRCVDFTGTDFLKKCLNVVVISHDVFLM
jgi:hypothetical protein